MTRTPRLTTLRPRVQMATPRIVARPPKFDDYYSSAEHRAWRRAVCQRAGWQCEAIENGRRCDKSAANGDRMFADHVVERRDGGADLGEGRCLCGSHHTSKTIEERGKRMR